MWMLLAALALAQAPCEDILVAPPDSLSVAWISPLRDKVGGKAWIEVVPTADLRTWLAGRTDTTVGDMLRRTGLRRRIGEPRRRYKVVIFDATTGGLCRPLEGVEQTEVAGGVHACPPGPGRATHRYTGCGYATDFDAERPGPQVFAGRWRDVARLGFCVIPAERFVSEGASPPR